MYELQIREFNAQDAARCAELALDAWPIAASVVPSKDAARLMSADVELCRIASTWLRVACISGEVVGLLFGRIDADTTALTGLKESFGSLKVAVGILLGRYGRIAEPWTLIKKTVATERKVGKNSPQAQAEVVLFIVAARFRSQGIGRTLLEQFVAAARAKHAQTVTVYTDPLSNWQFYEKYGFERHSTFDDDLNTYLTGEATEGYIYTLEV